MERHESIQTSVDLHPKYPAWKRHLWMQISQDAKVKKAFPSSDFDRSGLLKESKGPYRELSNWLGDIVSARKFECLNPSWEHNGDGKWELCLLNTDEWIHVETWGDQKAVSVKPGVKYKLPRGGVVIQGLVPELGHDYDFCELGPDDFVDAGEEVNAGRSS